MPNWFFWIALISIFAMAISWICFGRLTMARVERELKADHLPRPCPGDDPGPRIMWYAYAITLPIGRFNQLDGPTIDVPQVRRYAMPDDSIIRWILIISSGLLVTAAILAWFSWTGDP